MDFQRNSIQFVAQVPHFHGTHLVRGCKFFETACSVDLEQVSDKSFLSSEIETTILKELYRIYDAMPTTMYDLSSKINDFTGPIERF